MKHKRKGFTIVELVIVIAVIAILAGVLIPTFSNIVDKAKRSSATQECTNLYKNYYTLCKADSYSAKEGLILEDDGYYFTYMYRNLVEVNYVGKLESSNNVTLYFVGVNKYDTTTIFDAIYEIKFGSGTSYDVYTYEADDGIYAFYVNECFKSSNLSTKDINVYSCPICYLEDKSTNLLDFSTFIGSNAFELDLTDEVTAVVEEVGRYLTISVNEESSKYITEYEIGYYPGDTISPLKNYNVDRTKAVNINATDFKEVLNTGKKGIVLFLGELTE